MTRICYWCCSSNGPIENNVSNPSTKGQYICHCVLWWPWN